MGEKILYGTDNMDILEYDDPYDAAYDEFDSSNLEVGDIIEIFEFKQIKIPEDYKKRLYENVLNDLLDNYLDPDFGNVEVGRYEISEEMRIETVKYVNKILDIFEVCHYEQTKKCFSYKVISKNDELELELIN